MPNGEPVGVPPPSVCLQHISRALSSHKDYSEDTMSWADTTCTEGKQFIRRERRESHTKMFRAVNKRGAYEKGRQFSVAWISLSC